MLQLIGHGTYVIYKIFTKVKLRMKFTSANPSQQRYSSYKTAYM